MTPFEKQLAAVLLTKADERFSNFGCNDHELPNCQEAVDLLNAMQRENVGPDREPERVYEFRPEDGPTIFVSYDWWLMRLMADKIRAEVSGIELMRQAVEGE